MAITLDFSQADQVIAQMMEIVGLNLKMMASVTELNKTMRDLVKTDSLLCKRELGYIHYRRTWLRRALRQRVNKRRSRAYR
jgi:hypothetical protein